MMGRAKKTWAVWLILLVAVMMLLAGVVLVFSSARLQQSLLSREPAYDAATLYSRGLDQTEKGDFAAAEKSLEAALQQQDDTTYRGQLAVVKYRLKKYEESIKLYEKLIIEGKDAAFAWNGTGNAYRDWAEADSLHGSSRLQDAINAYEKAIVINPQYVAAYSNAGLLYASQGEQTKALEILDRGIAATSSQDLVTTRLRITQN